MRILVYIALLFSPNFWGQNSVGYLYEELPHDSVIYSVKDHHSVFPSVRTVSKNDFDFSFSRNKKTAIGFQVLGDQIASYHDSLTYRSGAGIGVESNFSNKWYLRVQAIGGIVQGSSFLTTNAIYSKLDNYKGQYLDVRGRVAYTPNDIFNFQVGLDHNYIGQGSRSLFLSDYGVPHPFAQIRTKFWRVEYTNFYQFYREKLGSNWASKFGATHHISLNIAKWLNLGIFETVLFSPKDTTLNRGFDAEYLNPVIFYRPQEYALGSADNVLLGMELNAYWKGQTFYSQFLLDEFFLSEIRAKSGWWANKFGAQAGIKGRFNTQKFLTKGNWFYRLEYNFTRPYTFAHLNALQVYGNQGSVLAHPYGANFMEIIGELKYQQERWLGQVYASYYLQGYDKEGFSYGGNIYLPYTFRPYDYDHFTGQGNGQNGFKLMLKGSYRILPQGNIQLFLENHLRYIHQQKEIRYIPVLGLRSQLWNDYRNY